MCECDVDCKSYVPIWEKANLTVSEGIKYSNIGEHTLRKELDKPNCPFALLIGVKKVLIKRKAFDKWLENQSQIEL